MRRSVGLETYEEDHPPITGPEGLGQVDELFPSVDVELSSVHERGRRRAGPRRGALR